jgi:hypothetical protein
MYIFTPYLIKLYFLALFYDRTLIPMEQVGEKGILVIGRKCQVIAWIFPSQAIAKNNS